jgi:hypothetical protein
VPEPATEGLVRRAGGRVHVPPAGADARVVGRPRRGVRSTVYPEVCTLSGNP